MIGLECFQYQTTIFEVALSMKLLLQALIEIDGQGRVDNNSDSEKALLSDSKKKNSKGKKSNDVSGASNYNIMFEG